MAFTDIDALLAGMVANGYRLPFQKSALVNQIAASETSFFRGNGFPTAGNIPTAAAICNSATVGSFPLATRMGTQERIVGFLTFQSSVAGNFISIEDRLAEMGGLSGIVTTAQTVGIDLNASLATSNLAIRIGAADYSEIEWYLEWYTTTGATVTTPTVAVTYQDGTTGTCNINVAGATALPGYVAPGRRYKIQPTNGKFIRSVESVTLSASTGTAGNFGVTAIKKLCFGFCAIANLPVNVDWSTLGAPKVPDSACLQIGMVPNAANTGQIIGMLLQAVA